jgi:hypothetical protein
MRPSPQQLVQAVLAEQRVPHKQAPTRNHAPKTPCLTPSTTDVVARTGGCSHRVVIRCTPKRIFVTLDPPACTGTAEEVLAALRGTRNHCTRLASITRRLIRAGFEPRAAVRWAATGVVDPQLRRSVAYGLPPGERYQHWIQAKLVGLGKIRSASRHPYLVLDEINAWCAQGWPPEEAAKEFATTRRPWNPYREDA